MFKVYKEEIELNGKKLINRSDFIEHKINFGAKSKKIIF